MKGCKTNQIKSYDPGEVVQKLRTSNFIIAILLMTLTFELKDNPSPGSTFYRQIALGISQAIIIIVFLAKSELH